MTSLAQDIARLLATMRGEPFLKRLFWELLGFDRVNQPVPISALPSARRSRLADCTILARREQVFVCHARFLVSEVQRGFQEPVLDAIARAWPSVLIVFSNFGGTELDFCWRRRGDASSATRRLIVDADTFALSEIAQLLSAVAAYNPASGAELPSLEVQDRLDRTFQRAPQRTRERHRADPVARFIRSLTAWPLLSENEEQEFGLAWRIDGDRAARERLICSNLRLVIKLAKPYRGRGLDFEDLIQEGCIGLIAATDRFDPTMGTRFSTYATYWIQQALRRAVQELPYLVSVPIYLIESLVEWKRTERRLERECGKRVDATDVDTALSLNSDTARRMRRVQAAMRTRTGEPEGDAAMSRLASRSRDDQPETQIKRADFYGFVNQVIDGMRERDGVIVRERIGLNGTTDSTTLAEIGVKLGLTRERIRQIEVSAMEELQRKLQRYREGVFE